MVESLFDVKILAVVAHIYDLKCKMYTIIYGKDTIMKLTKPEDRINKYNKVVLASIRPLAVAYGECTGTYIKCGGSAYEVCTGKYTSCQ